MTVQKFFEMLEKANEFKALVGEMKTVINVNTSLNIKGVYTYREFENVIRDTFAYEVATDILMADVQQTACVREFKITYIFDGEKNNIKLFVA